MNGRAGRFFKFGAALAGLVTLGWVVTGQAAKPAHDRISLPTDWTHRQIIFSHPRSAEQMARVSDDPRYQQQLHRSEQRLALPQDDAQNLIESALHSAGLQPGTGAQRDWSKNLGAGATVGAGNYPAKFSFDITTANCATATTPDYIVYSTGLVGSATQASIAGFDNLYSGCTGNVPSVYWAYNTGGQVLTSPLLSLDGTQIAFVETNAGAGTLVLLKWAAASGTLTAPATPALSSAAGYLTCTAPCMAQISLVDGTGTQTDDTTSSVFYDYTSDIAWVGGSGGWLHKITGVFKGVPSEVTTGGFPVQVNTGTALSSVVNDHGSRNVFVGDGDGFLYRVDGSTAAVTASGQLDFGAGIVQGPVLDLSNSLIYVFASSDGSSNCGAGTVACSAVYQLPTNFTAGSTGLEATVGNSVAVGTLPNPSAMYIGGFDSAYLNSVNASGNLYVCGNTGAAPTLYRVPIVAGVLGTSALISALTPANKTPACSPVTDFLNANASSVPTERVFFSVQSDGRPTSCIAKGCIMSFVTAPWQPLTAYATGQEVLVLRTANNSLWIDTVTVAGTTAATPPTWPASVGSLTVNGSVTFINQGGPTVATFATWAPTHAFALHARIVDSNNNVEIVSTAGTSGGSTPSWSATAGVHTSDGGVTWVNAGQLPSANLAATSGTSGIIIDNVVGTGNLAGASQVYFSTLGDQICGASGTGGCAVQASQAALQ
jgi:hypothetical protein